MVESPAGNHHRESAPPQPFACPSLDGAEVVCEKWAAPCNAAIRRVRLLALMCSAIGWERRREIAIGRKRMRPALIAGILASTLLLAGAARAEVDVVKIPK